MKYFKTICCIFILGLFSIQSFGQDIHFSQFYNSPLNLNPSLAGSFYGNYRFVGNYRNQWSSVTIPFSTISLSADANNLTKIKNLGLGVVFNHDNTGDSRFKTTILNTVASYRISLDKDSIHNLSGGIQIGFTNKNLSYDELRFDAQYNGARFDKGLPSRENFAVNSQIFMNLHIGLSYDYQIDSRKKWNIGISIFNITNPKESYFGNTEIRLDRRLTLHSTFTYDLTSEIDVLPSLFYMKQGKYFEFIFGALGKYTLSDVPGSYQAVKAGLFFRTKDAGYLTVGYDVNNWNLGLSYDINMSSLRHASNGRGGIELSAIYILQIFKPIKRGHKICPDYL